MSKCTWLIFITSLIFFFPGGNSLAADWGDLLKNVPDKYRDDVARNLELAAGEWNDSELADALSHYPAGSEKFRAICFIIAQLDKHLYVDYVNVDDPLNPFSPDGEDIDWAREYIYDYGTITSEMIIDDVEWAFYAREHFTWSKNLPENIFFEYVLPYRSTQEPLQIWRETMIEDLSITVQEMKTSLDVTQTVNKINQSRFHFDDLYYRHPEDRDIFTCLATGAGRCEDMSNVSNYSLRALGVATASDFTPWWPKGDNNHAWNTVYHNGKWYQFMGCEGADNPQWDTIKAREFGKVWRESFSADPIMGPSPDGTLPPRLMRISAIDVTAEYTTVSDVKIRVDNPELATYLCVFNYDTWQAVTGEWAENGTVHFSDLGNKDILYCATRYVEDETGWGDHFPVALPFALHGNGSIEFINPDPAATPTGDIRLTGWNPNESLTSGETVYLYRYIGTDPVNSESSDEALRWTLIGSGEALADAVSAYIQFENAGVDGSLYLLTNSEDTEDFRDNSRPFIWRNGEIAYY